MNNIFKVVFNAATRTFTAASEAAKAKHVTSTVLAGVVVVGASFANAAQENVDPTIYNQKDALTEKSDQNAIVGKINMLDGLTTYRLDGRDNELSAEVFKANQSSKNAIHYDNESLQVKTDGEGKPVAYSTDGVTWHTQFKDANGNDQTIDTLEWKSSDKSSITFAGKDGTKLKNVADGEVSITSKEAVNGSQLSAVKGIASAAQTNANANALAIGETNKRVTTLGNDVKAASTSASEAKSSASVANTKADTNRKNIEYIDNAQKVESTERIKNDTATNERIDTLSNTVTTETTNLWKDKASQKDVDTMVTTEAGNRAQADEHLQTQIDTKADAAEVNQWLETKVDNETFVSDQKRQDDAIKGKANSADLSVTNGQVASNTTAIHTETLDREAAIKDVVNTQSGVNEKLSAEDARLDNTKADKTALDAEVVTRQSENAVTGEKLGDLNNRTTNTENEVTGLSETVTRNSEAQSVINADVEARKADRSELTTAVNKQEQFNNSVETTQKNHSDRINAAQGTADKALQQGSINAQDIQTLNKDIQSVDHASKVRNEQTLKDANGYTDHKVNQVKRIATDGIASTAALSGIPQAIHAGRGNVGVGVANYNSSNAVAVGGSYRFSDDQTTIKFGVGTTGSNTVINAGAGYEF